jgi:phenylalanyl-tRNA synthetase beta chain
MLISLNWIRDYVDLPPDLDPGDLAERFTRTTAEVEGVHPIRVAARGLIAARVLDLADLPGTHNLRVVTLDVGRRKTVEAVTAAPALHEDCGLVYAPPGSSVASYGEIGTADVAGRASTGMILPGDALGIAMAASEAVFVSKSMEPGTALPPEDFEDWAIEIDNKSITHRPDLWGHYGIAREVAAILDRPLKPYPVADLHKLVAEDRGQVEIVIADGHACPRYSALRFEGVPTEPAPLWMQLRLGHVGLRPITGLVDLTNYIMVDLGQPMHAFDAEKVSRIEVDWASDGERFTTLDGTQRVLTREELMIKSSGHSIALAGVMGGLETEVSHKTTTLLLESANFDPATIRKSAIRLGLRTDASARFEKSLDPAHTVLAIERFVELAKPMYPDMRITSCLSDAFPKPPEPVIVRVDPRHVARTIGRTVPTDEMSQILTPLGFRVTEADDRVEVAVPSFRATGDVSIEDDVIEELARYIGYNVIRPTMPRVSIRRFEPNALHELENRTLEYFTTAHPFHEIQGYLWYDADFLARLEIDPGPCVELVNPAAEGLHLMRRSLVPGLLAAVARNRFHFPALALIELGSVFERGDPEDWEFRHVGLISARRGKRVEAALYGELKGAIEGWVWERFSRSAVFAPAQVVPERPWEHPQQTAEITIDGRAVGRISAVDVALRRAVDEHLTAWGITWAELHLNGLERLGRPPEPLDGIWEYPRVEMDFSILVPRSARYAQVTEHLAAFRHPLLKRLRYVACYEGDAIAPDCRSLTFRTTVGDDSRTLIDDDANAFRRAFEEHVKSCGYTIRR